MTSPMWPQLAGANAAAAMISFSGRLTSTSPRGVDVLDFWHAGGGRWRVERDGEVQHISDGGAVYYRGRDGLMVRAIEGRGFAKVWVTNGFGPTDLVGPDGMVHKMSRGVSTLTDPVKAVVDGRVAWATQLGREDSSPDARLIVSIDAQTGVIVGLTSGREALVEVTELSTANLDDGLFRWPTGNDPDPRPDPEQMRATLTERLRMLVAVEAGLERRAEVLAVVEASDTVDDARTAVADLLGVTRGGADVILSQQIRGFTSNHREKIRDEVADVRSSLAESDGPD